MNIAQMVKQFMSRFTGILNLAEYGAVLDGATDCLAAINAMIGDIGSRAVTLLVPGQCSVSGNVTIPSNIRVRFEANGGFVGAGVVTFTRWDLYCAAEYNTTIAQTIATSTITIVNYATFARDTDSTVTTGAAWHFTCPTGKGGDYLVAACATFAASPGTNPALLLYKNGVRTALLFGPLGGAAFGAGTGAGGAAIVTLAAGDAIDIRCFQNSGGNVNLDGNATDNRITVNRLVGS